MEKIKKFGKNSLEKMNFHTLPVKFSLFFDVGKEGAVLPFYMLFFIGVGLDTTEAGMISGLRFAGYMLGGPFWGYITDARNNHRYVLLFLCIMGIILNSIQPFLTIPFADPAINRCPAQNSTDFGNQIHSHREHFRDKLFYILLTINIIAAFFDGSTTSIVDAGAVMRIETSKKKVHYGREKVLAPVGYSFAVVMATKLADCFPIQTVTCYSSIFVTYFMMTTGLAVCSYFLFKTSASEQDIIKETLLPNKEDDVNTVKWEEDSHQLRKLLFNSLLKLDTVFFFVTVLITGTINHLYNSFSIIFLKEIHAPNTLLGLSLVAGAFSAIVAYSCSHYVIEFIGGPEKTMGVCLLAWFVRYLGLANLTNPWFVLLINLTNSFSFAIMTTAFIENVKLISDPRIWTTMYGLLHALFLGVSGIISHVAGGYLYEAYGGRRLFKYCAYITLSWAVVLAAFVLFKSRHLIDKTYAKTIQKDDAIMSNNIVYCTAV